VTLPAFIEAGDGDTLVLMLHGIGGGAAIWGERGSDSVRALAAAGFKAVAMDFPGYGASQALGVPAMAAMVSSVVALVQSFKPRRTVLVGHSMGGMVAQELVALGGAPVDALVLACTSASFGKSDGAWQAQFIASRLAPLDAGLGMAGMAAQLVPGLVAPNAATHARELATQVMSAVPEATYREALRAIASFDRRVELARISVPTLLLAAAQDQTAPPEVMRRMAERVPGAQYVCLADAGHIANVEQPQAFNAALLGFLRQHFY
jgi:3-oxoadipate enol-lactonase